jgi:hypothetical protein
MDVFGFSSDLFLSSDVFDSHLLQFVNSAFEVVNSFDDGKDDLAVDAFERLRFLVFSRIEAHVNGRIFLIF